MIHNRTLSAVEHDWSRPRSLTFRMQKLQPESYLGRVEAGFVLREVPLHAKPATRKVKNNAHSTHVRKHTRTHIQAET